MKKKIAYLCIGSAVSSHVHEIIEGLQRRGWTVDLFEPLTKTSVLERGRLRSLWEYLEVQFRLWRTARDVDAIYIRHHPLASLTVAWARRRRIPVIQELNGLYEDFAMLSPLSALLWPAILRQMRQGIRRSSAVITVTEQIGQDIRDKRDSDHVVVIPNGANIDRFRPDAPTDMPQPAPYVVWFGYMGPWQGIDTILRAVEDPAWPAGLALVLIGDGPKFDDARAAAQRNPRVTCLGKLPIAQVAGIVARSQMGLSPQNDFAGRSSRGGLAPLKVYETLASGVPIIVTAFPGQGDLVTAQHCGLAIPPDDPAALARAVAALAADDAGRRAMGRRGRELIVAEHSWDRRAGDTEQVILDSIAREGRTA